jgi:hypothetical protein
MPLDGDEAGIAWILRRDGSRLVGTGGMALFGSWLAAMCQSRLTC